jgi:hypothetical protein
VVTFDLYVIFDAGEGGNGLAMADESLGLGETIASRINLFRLFFNVLEETLQEAARFGHFTSLPMKPRRGEVDGNNQTLNVG